MYVVSFCLFPTCPHHFAVHVRLLSKVVLQFMIQCTSCLHRSAEYTCSHICQIHFDSNLALTLSSEPACRESGSFFKVLTAGSRLHLWLAVGRSDVPIPRCQSHQAIWNLNTQGPSGTICLARYICQRLRWPPAAQLNQSWHASYAWASVHWSSISGPLALPYNTTTSP